MVPIDGNLWKVALVEEDEHRRLIVSHAQELTMPTHVVMCQLRNLFFSDEAMVVQVYTNSVDPPHYIQTLYELSIRVYPFVWDSTPLPGANDETDTA